jgi:hypothetical protein
MNKILTFGILMLISSGCFAQVVGRVDIKTKEFSIAPGQKVDIWFSAFSLPMRRHRS